MPTLTVFTPTYNRAHTLPRAFESLRKQTSCDFVWLVVDDGSTDGTQDLVMSWKPSAAFGIDYLYQQNRGKHNAHNTAVARTQTELFLILDSDDELLPHAVEKITSAWKQMSLEEKSRIAGIWTLCVNPAGNVIGGLFQQPVFDSSLQELRYRHKIDQEMLACFATAVIRRYPFPETAPGACPYIPESYVWMRITKAYLIRFLNVPCRIYHDSDGLSVMERHPYRVGGCIVYSYLGPLANELEWFWFAPTWFLVNAVQTVRYGIYSGQCLKLTKTLPWRARALILGALPVGILLLARDWISGRIARQRRGATASVEGLMISRRGFMQLVSGAAAAVLVKDAAPAQSIATIDVKALGAFGNGKLPDLRQIREAIRLAAERRGGATIVFPPGDYYLGAIDDNALLVATRLDNVRFVGERATLSCRSVNGQSDILQLAGCRNVTIEGLKFRDHGMNREINWLGAAAVRLANDGPVGCENIEIRNCEFDSVLSAVVCRRPDDNTDNTRCRDIRLMNLSVTRSYYGFNFQDNGDHVTGRVLRCSDVRRSYFPYGVSHHDIELEATNNATRYTDVLIKCYHNDTVGIKAKVKSRGKRGGDAIVILDHQHEKGRGTIRNINLELDVDDVDCRLDAVVLIRSSDPNARLERQTQNRWDDITIDGDVRICDKTKLIDIATVSRTPGRLRIGERLAKNPRLPRTFPGFMVDGI